MDLSDKFEHGVNLNHHKHVLQRQQLSPPGISPIASPASPNGSSNGVESGTGSLSPLAQYAAGSSSQLKMQHNGHSSKSPPAPLSAVFNSHQRVLTGGSTLTAVINGAAQSDPNGSSQNKQLGVIQSPPLQIAGLSPFLPQTSSNGGGGSSLHNRGAVSALSPPHMALIKQVFIPYYIILNISQGRYCFCLQCSLEKKGIFLI